MDRENNLVPFRPRSLLRDTQTPTPPAQIYTKPAREILDRGGVNCGNRGVTLGPDGHYLIASDEK